MPFYAQLAIQSEISSLAVIPVKLTCYLSGCGIILKKKIRQLCFQWGVKKHIARTKHFCFFVKDSWFGRSACGHYSGTVVHPFCPYKCSWERGVEMQSIAIHLLTRNPREEAWSCVDGCFKTLWIRVLCWLCMSKYPFDKDRSRECGFSPRMLFPKWPAHGDGGWMGPALGHPKKHEAWGWWAERTWGAQSCSTCQ